MRDSQRGLKTAVPSAIVLAGGLGTRLRGLFPDTPKPMVPVGARPFLEHLLDYWIAQGMTRFVLSVGYRHEVISDHFGNLYRGAELEYVVEQTPLGTGGGLLLAAEKIGPDAPFLLLNGDTYFAVDLQTLSGFARTNDADWCFCLFHVHPEQAIQRGSGRVEERYMGVTLSPQGKVIFLNSGALANGGVYLVHPRALTGCGFVAGDRASLEEDILPAAHKAGRRLFGLEFRGSFIDIGVPDDCQRAVTLLK